MNRHTVLLAVLVVAVMTVVAVPAAGIGPDGLGGGQVPASNATDGAAKQTGTEATTNDTEEEPLPGSTLTGVVGVQEAEIEGEVEIRGFEAALNSTGDNASRQAGVIANQVKNLEARLEELRERKGELERAREDGNITDGGYRARIAEVVTRIGTLQRLANRTTTATRGIPAETLQDRGVDGDAIQELRQNARNLSGPEVATIARGIAGAGAGRGLGVGPPENRTGRGNGPPGNGNGNRQGDGAPGNGNGNGQGDGAPGNGQGDGPPGNGNGNGQTTSRPGAGSTTTPGSNASDNGSDGPARGPPGADDPAGDDLDSPGADDPGDETTPDNATTSSNRTVSDNAAGTSGERGTSEGRTVGDSGDTRETVGGFVTPAAERQG